MRLLFVVFLFCSVFAVSNKGATALSDSDQQDGQSKVQDKKIAVLLAAASITDARLVPPQNYPSPYVRKPDTAGTFPFANYNIFREYMREFNEKGDQLLNKIYHPLFGKLAKKDRIVRVMFVRAFQPEHEIWVSKYKGQTMVFVNLLGFNRPRIREEGRDRVREFVAIGLNRMILPEVKSHRDIDRLKRIVVERGTAAFLGYADRHKLLTEEYLEKRKAAENWLTEAEKKLREGVSSAEERKKILDDAVNGDFWKRYAVVAGMFRAAEHYHVHGPQGILNAVYDGKLDRLVSKGPAPAKDGDTGKKSAE